MCHIFLKTTSDDTGTSNSSVIEPTSGSSSSLLLDLPFGFDLRDMLNLYSNGEREKFFKKSRKNIKDNKMMLHLEF